MKLIISCRSEAESNFFFQISKSFNNKDFIFITFNQNIKYDLLYKGRHVYDIFDFINKKKNFPKIKLNEKIAHEKREFNLSNDKKLFNKYNFYFSGLSSIYIDIKKKYKKEKLICIQEIGGFISHQVFYDFFRKKNIDVIHLEPSLFKDRFFILKNTYFFKKFKLKRKLDNKLLDKKINFLIKTKPLSFINLHKKRYRSSYKKIFDLENIKKLIFKLYTKYILNRKYDYDYIFSFSINHLKMFLYQTYLSFFYKNNLPKNFVYFPLHVPNDISLTIRAKSYLDQFDLIDKIAKSLPKNFFLVIKEHPSFIGNYSLKKMLNVIRNNKIILFDPFKDNYEIIKNASLVCTINSKTGAESIVLKKKNYIFGKFILFFLKA